MRSHKQITSVNDSRGFLWHYFTCEALITKQADVSNWNVSCEHGKVSSIPTSTNDLYFMLSAWKILMFVLSEVEDVLSLSVHYFSATNQINYFWGSWFLDCCNYCPVRTVLIGVYCWLCYRYLVRTECPAKRVRPHSCIAAQRPLTPPDVQYSVPRIPR